MLTSDKLHGVILQRERDLRNAEVALDEMRRTPSATANMIDSAYRAIEAIKNHIEQLRDDFFKTLDAEESAYAVNDELRVNFDVPGTVTLQDVSTPKWRETYEERVIRLAKKAVIEGCTIVHEDRISSYVTSSQDHTKTYWVGVDLLRARCGCECDGFTKGAHKMCKHLALVLIHRGVVKPATNIAA